MTSRSLRLAAVVVAVASVAVGCGSSSDSTSETTSSVASTSKVVATAVAKYREEPSNIPNWPALPKRAPTGVSLYYLNTGSGSGQRIARNIKRAAQALGWNVHVLTYNQANLSTANSAYLTAVNSGADAIISSGLDHNAIKQGLDAAKAKKIPVVQTNSIEAPEATDFAQVANYTVSQDVYAKATALGIVAAAEKRNVAAHVGVVTTSGIPIINSLAKAKAKSIEDACPKCTAKLIDVPVAQMTGGQASQAVVSFMQQNPKTNYITIDGPFEGGLRAALDGVGLRDVQIAGLQPSEAQNQEVKKGDSLFWVNVSFGYYAWSAVDAVARALTGGDPKIHNSEKDLVWLVDRENLNFDPRTLPDFPKGYEEQFKKLWHVQ